MRSNGLLYAITVCAVLGIAGCSSGTLSGLAPLLTSPEAGSFARPRNPSPSAPQVQ